MLRQYHRIYTNLLKRLRSTSPAVSPLLRPDLLQLLRAVNELIRISLGYDLPHIGLLHKVLVALLVGKVDGVVFAVEVQVCALHEVGRRLPAHERVLPSMAFAQRIPVHAPLVRCPVAGLCGCLRWLVDAREGG